MRSAPVLTASSAAACQVVSTGAGVPTTGISFAGGDHTYHYVTVTYAGGGVTGYGALLTVVAGQSIEANAEL